MRVVVKGSPLSFSIMVRANKFEHTELTRQDDVIRQFGDLNEWLAQIETKGMVHQIASGEVMLLRISFIALT